MIKDFDENVYKKDMDEWTPSEYLQAFEYNYPISFKFFQNAIKIWNRLIIHLDTDEDMDELLCQPLNMAKAICTDFGEKEACRIAKAILANYYEKGY